MLVGPLLKHASGNPGLALEDLFARAAVNPLVILRFATPAEAKFVSRGLALAPPPLSKA